MATQYLSIEDVDSLHEAILVSMGEDRRALLRPGALDSAIHRPQLAAHYENADLATQAALLIGGIAMAHAFEDGNKRTALMAGDVFLYNNGWWVLAEPLAFAKQVEALVDRPDSADAATERLASWLRERLRPVEVSGRMVQDGHYYDLPVDVRQPGTRESLLELVEQSQGEAAVTLTLGNMPLFGGVRLFILSDTGGDMIIVRAFARDSTQRPRGTNADDAQIGGTE